MGRLIIKRVVYKGDNYFYESPEFATGVQIVEGDNGTGKTTFSALICYGLGVYVKQFEPNEVEKHEEIMTDTNNSVYLAIQIDDAVYTLQRFFKEHHRNFIIVGNNGKAEKYWINRLSGEPVFSDWILGKLGIEVCDVPQGSRSFKINLNDLLRLINYDQETSVDKIYKEHRNSGNQIVDSIAVRKIIFELLIGYRFSEYYALLGKKNQAERVKDSLKFTLDNYVDMAATMGYDIAAKTLEATRNELTHLRNQFHVLEFQRSEIKVSSTAEVPQLAKKYAASIADIEQRISEKRVRRRNVSNELRNIVEIKKTATYEIEQIQKIILTSAELNLFSLDTCPCCLRKTSRAEGTCICGQPLDEGMYERFFYNSEEYLDILKTKEKSLKTMDVAIASCEKELDELNYAIGRMSVWNREITERLNELKDTEKNNPAVVQVKELSDKILEVGKFISELEQREVVLNKYSSLSRDYETAKNAYDALRIEAGKKEVEVSTFIKEIVKRFNEVYNELMTNADNSARSARIDDESYMPIINEGTYRPASKNVSKRLMYYFTLLYLSLESKSVAFPRFLLIDTPETLGIDKQYLVSCLKQLEKLLEAFGADSFQVILTTGVGKYPKSLKESVRIELDESRLLQRTEAKAP